MATSLERFAKVTIRRATRFASRPNFGMVNIVGYHTAWPQLSRLFTEASELIDAGLDELDPIYLAAVALCSQENRPDSFKVGKRTGAPTQSMRLIPSTPAEGDVYSVTIRGVTFSVTADAGESVATLLDELVLQVNADVDAILATGGATALTPQTLDSTDFDGVIGAGTDATSPARNLTFVLSNHADWDAVTIVVTGRSPEGRVQTESFTVPNGGNATLTGTKLFDMSPAGLAATTVLVPAGSGTGGTFTIGVGKKFDEDGALQITATDGTTHADIAVDVAGQWNAWTDLTDNWSIEDRTAVPGTTLTTDLTAIRDADGAWYGLIIADAQSEAQIVQAAAWAELETVLYLSSGIDTDDETDDEAGISRAIQDLGYVRSKHWHTRKNHGAFMEAAVAGAVLGPYRPGAADFEYKSLTGIVADEFSESVITRLVGSRDAPTSGKNGAVYIGFIPTGTNSGSAYTYGGLTAGGEWADVIVGLDFAESELQLVSFDYRVNNPKPPYTDAGIDAFDGLVKNKLLQLSEAPYNIFDPTSIVVQSTALSGTTAEQRQARHYDGTKFGARPQGAIRSIDFGGTVSP